MSEAQNAAARLHRLLTEFAAHPNKSTRQAWAVALEVEEPEVSLHLGRVGTLLLEVRRLAEETGRKEFTPIAGHLVTLSQSIFPDSHGLTKQSQHAAPDPTALQALNMFSAYLEQGQPEATVPPTEDIEELRKELRDLMAQVTSAELAPGIKRALLTRLGDVLEAMDHLASGGPDGVRRAAEALGLSALLFGPEVADADLLTRVKATARKTWAAFTIATQLAAAVLTWDKVVDLALPQGEGPPKQLPPPASDARDTGASGDDGDSSR